MLQNKQRNTEVVVFSRWSRKNYAVFASLKKVILIARLAFDICEASLRKNPAIINILQQCDSEQEEEIEPDVLSHQEELLFKAELLPVTSALSEVYQEKYLFILKKPVFCVMQSAGFFILTKFL